jgi:molybdate transport system substrate-binding protein
MTTARSRIPKLGRLALLAVLACIALIVTGCGDGSDSPDQARDKISVSAAASLTEAFDDIAEDFEPAFIRFQFAGSDALAAQIEKGARPEVFAAANTTLPDRLFKDGLVEKPVPFATNTLVLAVPKSSSKISSLSDLTGDGISIAVGAKSVPVGNYTRQVLAKLPAAQEKAIVGNIKSEESDVKGVVGKLATGAVDAGFVYFTDVRDADDELKAILLPAELQPKVVYSAALVKGSDRMAIGRQFINYLLSKDGQKELADEGFGPPPS